LCITVSSYKKPRKGNYLWSTCAAPTLWHELQFIYFWPF